MAQRYTVSLPDELAARVDETMDGYGDNRSELFAEALRDHFGMEAEDA